MIIIVAIVLFVAASTSEGCMCMPAHPQQQMCREDSFVLLMKVRSQAYVKTLDPAPYGGDDVNGWPMDARQEKFGEMRNIIPTAPYDEVVLKGEDRERADYIRYRIKIYKTYKGVEGTKESRMKYYIYTRSDEGICGGELNLKGTYLVTGSVRNGRLVYSICDHVIDWKPLPKAEKQNIRANMRRIESVCKSDCDVISCLWSNCSPKNRTECSWNSEMEREYGPRNYDRANFLCSPDSEGRCEWSVDSLVETGRLTRRRRHSRRSLKRRNAAKKRRQYTA